MSLHYVRDQPKRIDSQKLSRTDRPNIEKMKGGKDMDLTGKLLLGKTWNNLSEIYFE